LKRFIITFLLGGASMVLLASVLVHPSGPVKATHSTGPLLAGAEIDPAVKALIEKSCRNCHSEKTEWPFYSYIAPMSWLVEGDVGEARSHMNLSRWGDYSLEEKEQLLASIGVVVRSGKMPPARYTAIHTDAKLSAEDGARIYEWAHAERRRLKLAVPASTGAGL
jgi:heme-binding protein